jgi:hypothetical protein
MQGFVGEIGENRMDQNMYCRVEDDGVNLELLQPMICVGSTACKTEKNNHTLEGPRQRHVSALKLHRVLRQCLCSSPIAFGNLSHIERNARVNHKSL